jgi:transcriptional regulator with XRE-family HTH domain
MRELSMEQVEYAVARLARLVESREMTQTQLEQASGVKQSTISKILARPSDNGGERYMPSEEVLGKLFQALGLKLTHILNESDSLCDEILGYLATPLTALTPECDKELRRVVEVIREIAEDGQFAQPKFKIYWPGDHTHPLQHADISATQVYVRDRSRASTHDFIVLLCASPSYGVGQENELATQAGVPAIRLMPKDGLSRMMSGSFIRASDVHYTGSLTGQISFDPEKMMQALREVRRIYFRHHAIYRDLHSDAFGSRLKRLIVDRCGGDYRQFADDVGISLTYLHHLMEEPFGVANPSARLLLRMARLLGERVAYLLGEAEEADPVWLESHNSWRLWVDSTPSVQARLALQIREQWRHDYRTASREQQKSSTSFRGASRIMSEADWDKLYCKKADTQEAATRQGSLL